MNRSYRVVICMEGWQKLFQKTFFCAFQNRPKSDRSTDYYYVDDEVHYDSFYSDFGPLNLSVLYRFCRNLTERLEVYLTVIKSFIRILSVICFLNRQVWFFGKIFWQRKIILHLRLFDNDEDELNTITINILFYLVYLALFSKHFFFEIEELDGEKSVVVCCGSADECRVNTAYLVGSYAVCSHFWFILFYNIIILSVRN